MVEINPKSNEIELQGNKRIIEFIETLQVKEGVECDIYKFKDDASSDIAVVRVSKGYKTPLQRILQGDETIEIYASGDGSLSVWGLDSDLRHYSFSSGDAPLEISVNVGEQMQWAASNDNDLTFYELCTPPYEEGRFENLE